MTMTVANTKLLQSFFELFKINAVFLCLDNNDDDTMWGLAQTLSDHASVEHSIQEREHLVQSLLALENKEGFTLIVCQGMDIRHPELFYPGFVWLFLDHKLPPNLPLRLDSSVFTLHEDGRHVLEWYRVKSGPYITKTFATFADTSHELAASEVDHMWGRRTDLMGVPLINTVLEFQPFTYMPEGQPPRGMAPDLLSLLQDMLNFTVTYTSPADRQWGSPVSPSSPLNFTGMVGMVARKEADLSSAGLTVTRDRQQVVDFTAGFYDDWTAFFVKRSVAAPPVNFTAYVDVFNSYSWLMIGLMMLSAGVVAFTLRNFGKDSSWASTGGLALAFKALLQLSHEITSANASSKILVLSISFSAFFLFAHFTADLTAMMTHREPPPTLRSFEDVLAQGYQVIVWAGTSADTYLANALPGTYMQRAYQETMEGNPSAFVQGEAEAYEVLSAEKKSVFFGSQMGFFGVSDIERLAQLEDSIFSALGIALQKDSEFLDVFNFHLLKMWNTGHIDKLIKKWTEDGPKDDSKRIFVDDAVPLGFDSVLFMALIMLGGMSTSVAILAFEKLSALCSLSFGEKE